MDRRWAVILAGGDGRRLQGLTTDPTGEAVPKQFCRLLGGRTLLDDTRRRLVSNVDDARTLLVFSSKHLRHYATLKSTVPASLLVEQPGDLGTGAAMALALGRVARVDPQAVVGFFPCDHHYTNVAAFQQAVSIAYQVADLNRDRLVLVGANAVAAEPEYGWIEPGRPLLWPATDGRLFTVNRFWEKPGLRVARRLLRLGCLWNTFVVVGAREAYETAFLETEPALATLMADVAAAPPGEPERQVVQHSYARLSRTCFSKGVLSRVSGRAAVVPLLESGWIDIGSPDRLAGIRADMGLRSA